MGIWVASTFWLLWTFLCKYLSDEPFSILFFKDLLKKILFIFREGKGRKKRGREKGEKHQCVVASCTPPTGDLTCNPGLCPDWESNWQPFGSQAHAQSTELHQPGPIFYSLKYMTRSGIAGAGGSSVEFIEDVLFLSKINLSKIYLGIKSMSFWTRET